MIYFTLGPSQLYKTVPNHIQIALDEQILSLSHRSKKFESIFADTTEKLRELMSIPLDYHVFFLGSATEATERIIQNTVKNKSLHLVNGAFSEKYCSFSTELGKRVQKIEAKYGQGFDIEEARVEEDVECIFIVQNETSTGVIVPMEDVYKLQKQNPTALMALDVVSSAPYVSLNFQFLDMVYFSVQKGFGLPSGLGVLIVSPKAVNKAIEMKKDNQITGTFHSFIELQKYALKNQTPETPNVLGIYLLGKVCGDFLHRGIAKIRRETDEKAELIYDFFDKHKKYKPFVRELKHRSKTSIVIDTGGDAEKVLTCLKSRGFMVGSGYGVYKSAHIRIGNFPSHTFNYIRDLLRCVDEV